MEKLPIKKVYALNDLTGTEKRVNVVIARGTGEMEVLITEFSKIEDSPNSLLLKWAIGNTLSVIADDEVFEKIVDLVHN